MIGVIDCQTKNVGDDMQTLAALQFAPDAKFVRRDKIGEETRDLKIIGNAWWMEGECYPRANQNILPISMHIWNDGFPMDWLKVREPIGCRDTWTMNRLKENSIKAYFSGCLTLTFPEYKGKRDGIVYVDDVPREWKIEDALYLSHTNEEGDSLSPSKRMKIAQERLDVYKKARLVITNRLHVALPCVAVGTPVLINDKVWAKERFSGYNLPTEFKGLDADYKVPRPTKLIENLKKRVHEYIS